MQFSKWLLTEEKQDRIVVYHGTSSKLLKVILSQGLDPFPKKRVWDQDQGSFHSPSKASIGGIYVTSNLMTATSSAFKAAKRDKANELLVVMEIHPHSTVADEDDFLSISRVPIPGLVTTDSTVSRVYVLLQFIKNPHLTTEIHFTHRDKEYFEEVKEHFVEESMKTLRRSVKNIHPALEKRLKELLRNEGFEAALTRQTAHSASRSFLSVCYDYSDPCPFTLPDINLSEQKWSRFLDKITKTFKQMAYPNSRNNNFNQTSRLLKPIGFSGKDKIVCVVEILPPTEEMKYVHPVKIHYGNPPQILIDDWKKSQGSWLPS